MRREVANLTERKNPHTPVYGVKKFVCLSNINFDPNYLTTGRAEWAEIFLGHLWQKYVPPQKMVKWVYLDLI